MCGIPSITLEGTVEDWKMLREKTLTLSRFDFQWWTDTIKPILDDFVNASCGNIDAKKGNMGRTQRSPSLDCCNFNVVAKLRKSF